MTFSHTPVVRVPHLGGIDVAYRSSPAFDSGKPTLVLINSFTTTSDLFDPQFQDEKLKETVNLVAIEPLGHGRTRTKARQWTYWDTAVVNIQVLDSLGLRGKVFVLGTSQGGWIAVRMALVAPERVAGIIALGTSMDLESERSRLLGCWNAPELVTQFIDEWTTNETTLEFELSDAYCSTLVDSGFGQDIDDKLRNFWIEKMKSSYRGDEGRRQVRMAAINLRDRDGLHGRLFDIRCPVLWLHGTSDAVYSVKNANEEIKLFANSPDAQLRTIDGGQHFLSGSHPKEVDEAIVAFVEQYGNIATLTRVDRHP